MKSGRMSGIAGTYAVFQAVMPMAGWVCVHTIVENFRVFEKFIPWIALILLMFIGGKMLVESFGKKEDLKCESKVSVGILMVQGIATSIDALSVGFTIADYGWVMALVCSGIIAVVTFVICMFGLEIGKKFGTKFSNRAELLGGIILILIGLEIFIKGVI